MIEMHVAGIAIDAGNQTPIVILRDAFERRALPIWIGKAEANAILQAMEDEKTPRPMTHDLLVSGWTTWGVEVEKVIIHALHDSTYYAVICTVRDEVRHAIDARPSDAIAIAMRMSAPIWVVEEVMSEASIPMNQDADQEEREAFHQFVQNLSPKDFVMRS
ncbi:MAG: bifunctional nuclease family protein [Synechococcales cyanobacterium]